MTLIGLVQHKAAGNSLTRYDTVGVTKTTNMKHLIQNNYIGKVDLEFIVQIVNSVTHTVNLRERL